MRKILLKMYTKYPEMQVHDAVKLLFQSEFGGGHMISDIGKSLDWIKREYKESTRIFKKVRQDSDNNEAQIQCEDANDRGRSPEYEKKYENIYEHIGGGMVRMNLSVLDQGLRPETLNRMFVLTAQETKGSVEKFEEKLQILLKCCEDGELPFSAEEVRNYLKEYKAKGYPAVSHSEIYRERYHPSYRVVSEKFARYYPVFLEIDRVLSAGEKKQILIAVDGMCGAGKSTLASLLKEVYDCNLFHMDDFFLQPHQRTPGRYAEPGGNVDYERFKEEVLEHIADSEGFSYQIFDCSRRALGERCQVSYKQLNIIEGSYSQHPYFGDVYDLRFFCGIEEEEQLRRIERRNGAAMLERFKKVWIPMENRYLETFGIAKKSIHV